MDIVKIKRQLTQAGLANRPSQLQMIEQVFQALTEKKILCIEAPTGTGKTLSYSIGAFFARNDQQTIIVSTATIALQEQLAQKDLPLLAKLLNIEIKTVLAKGRRRYVCHARLYEEQTVDFFSANEFQPLLRSLLEQGEWDGDRDSLKLNLTDAQWLQVSTDSPGCSGKHCQYFQQCAFYKAKQKWPQADFIVTNHSLLLADLSLGGGALLPEMAKSIYILDEAHHFPEKALDHFAHSTALLASVEWINPLLNSISKAAQNELIQPTKQSIIQEMTQQLVVAIQALEQFLQLNRNLFTEDQNKEGMWRCTEDQQPVFTLVKPLVLPSGQLAAELQQILSEWLETLKTTMEGSEKQAILTKSIAQLGFFYSRADNFYQTMQLFCQVRKPQEAPFARWFIRNSREQFFCHVSPINISQYLKELFWDKLSLGVLLCSATLRTAGQFTDFLRKTGLVTLEKRTEYALETCFDYTKSVLFAPSMRSSPLGNDQTAHWQETVELLPELLLPKSGTLVLFTSKLTMEKTFEKLPSALQADILMQGVSGKSMLLTRHKEKINQGQRSILFGLASFGEGLDLPAQYCQHVIIHKLPFAVPTTPIELTRNEWLTQNNRNPFELATLPATGLRLAQYVGRLIRQETDIGIVTILDKRIYSKPYGLKLLKGLPPFTQVLNSKVVELKKIATIAHLFV